MIKQWKKQKQNIENIVSPVEEAYMSTIKDVNMIVKKETRKKY